MHEAVLRDFFLGIADIATLHRDMEGTVVRTSHDVFTHHVIAMDSEFTITRAHLIALCDAVLVGDLPPTDLSAIAFALETSDHFQWDFESPEAELISETLADWSSPEINYPPTLGMISKFRHRLATGEDAFTRADIPPQ
jgi:hypothetical protein